MSNLSSTQESALRSMIEGLGPSLSNAISENVGRLVLVDEPTVVEKPVAQLVSDAAPLLQTTWDCPELESGTGSGQITMILSGRDAIGLCQIVTGESPLQVKLSDAILPVLTPVMSGLAYGFAVALGNQTERSLQVQNLVCLASPFSPGEGLLGAGSAVAIEVHFHVQEGPDGTLTLFLTPSAAVSLVESAGGTGAASTFESLGLANNETEGMEPVSNSLSADGMGEANEHVQPAPAAIGPGPSSLQTEQPANPFQTFSTSGGVPLPDGVSRSMELIMDIPLDVSVELGRVQMLIKDVLELATGSIVELERVAGEPVDLLVNGQLIAKGEVVVIEDNFGIRITEIVSPADRLSGMGKRAA
jgi:flagellar motor switch protein FliN/FliY